MARFRAAVTYVALPLGLLATWQVAVQAHWVSQQVLVSPADVARAFVELSWQESWAATWAGRDNPARHGLRHRYGLGLSIAQAIVHAHKGKISVASTLGKGTTFTVDLPLGTGCSASLPFVLTDATVELST